MLLLSFGCRIQKQGHCVPYWIQIVIESRPFYNYRHCIKHCLLSLCHLSKYIYIFSTLALCRSLLLLRVCVLFACCDNGNYFRKPLSSFKRNFNIFFVLCYVLILFHYWQRTHERTKRIKLFFFRCILCEYVRICDVSVSKMIWLIAQAEILEIMRQ